MFVSFSMDLSYPPTWLPLQGVQENIDIFTELMPDQEADMHESNSLLVRIKSMNFFSVSSFEVHISLLCERKGMK